MQRGDGLKRPSRIAINAPSILVEDRVAVDAVLQSGWVGSGPECEAFEQEIAAYLGADHVVCVSSCTAGLELLFDHLAIGPDARVAVPAWTHPATALPLAIRGAQIVLVDSDPDTMAMSPDSLRAALSSGVDLVVPVHFAGVPIPTELTTMCQAEGVPVIEDAAHAFGAADRNGPIRGGDALAAVFSFHATKNLTCGEGGAVVTTDADLAEWLRHHRNHGIDRDAWSRERSGDWGMGDIVEPGRKANLPDVLAALGRSQLRRFDRMQSHRRGLMDRYRTRLGAVPGVALVPSGRHEGSADHLAVVRLPSACRDDVVRRLSDAGIATGLHFPPLHHHTWFRRHAEIPIGGLPVCEAAARQLLTLPLHGQLTADDVDEVAAAVAVAVAAGRRSVGSRGPKPSPPRYIDSLLPDFRTVSGNGFNHLGHWDDPTGRVEPGSRAEAQARMNDLLVGLAALDDGSRVLDVGSGFGGTLRAIDRDFRHMALTGLDVDERQLDLCRASVASPTNSFAWVRGDGSSLPFHDACFDRVISIEAMWHFPSRRRFLDEAARVLRPDGRLAVVDVLVEAGAAERRGTTMRCLQERLETSFAPWPGIRDTLDDILDWARIAGLRPDAVIDATEHTKPTYLDHGDADDRPGAARFSSSEGVQTFVEMHQSNEIRVVYLAFERPDPVEEP